MKKTATEKLSESYKELTLPKLQSALKQASLDQQTQITSILGRSQINIGSSIAKNTTIGAIFKSIQPVFKNKITIGTTFNRDLFSGITAYNNQLQNALKKMNAVKSIAVPHFTIHENTKKLKDAIDLLFNTEFSIIDTNNNQTTIRKYRFIQLIEYIEETESEFKLEEINSIHQIALEKLNELNPKYSIMLRGAYESVENKQNDYQRHTLVSLRELVDSMLKDFAPAENVLDWVNTLNLNKSEKENYIRKDNKKPTKRAHIEYICGQRETNYFNNYLLKNKKLLLKIVRNLSKLHEDVTTLHEQELIKKIVITEAWIIFLYFANTTVELREIATNPKAIE